MHYGKRDAQRCAVMRYALRWEVQRQVMRRHALRRYALRRRVSRGEGPRRRAMRREGLRRRVLRRHVMRWEGLRRQGLRRYAQRRTFGQNASVQQGPPFDGRRRFWQLSNTTTAVICSRFKSPANHADLSRGKTCAFGRNYLICGCSTKGVRAGGIGMFRPVSLLKS